MIQNYGFKVSPNASVCRVLFLQKIAVDESIFVDIIAKGSALPELLSKFRKWI